MSARHLQRIESGEEQSCSRDSTISDLLAALGLTDVDKIATNVDENGRPLPRRDLPPTPALEPTPPEAQKTATIVRHARREAHFKRDSPHIEIAGVDYKVMSFRRLSDFEMGLFESAGEGICGLRPRS